jgi:hypothetical protein
VARLLNIHSEPRGFGFIIFESLQAVENVFKVAVHIIDQKTVECKRAVPKEPGTKPFKDKKAVVKPSVKAIANDTPNSTPKKVEQTPAVKTNPEAHRKLFEYLEPVKEESKLKSSPHHTSEEKKVVMAWAKKNKPIFIEEGELTLSDSVFPDGHDYRVIE